MQSPTQETLDKLFYSIPDAFASYPTTSFSFILGKAIALDEKTQVLTIQTEDDKKDTIHYDSLIIATGTTSASPLWTLQNSFADTASAFEDVSIRLASPDLNEVLVVGGGAAGVETAGQLGYRFRKMKKVITLFSGAKELLPRYHHAGVSRAAEAQLSSLGVTIVHNLRVVSTSTLADGKTELHFSDDSKKAVDLCIDATGGQPNTSFLPPSWLDSTGKVIAESKTLRTPVKNVYAIGDAASFSLGNLMDSSFSIPALCYSIYEDGSGGGKEIKMERYRQYTSAICFIPIGPKGGVGAVFGWKLPSWLVWVMKSRDYMIGQAPWFVNGMAYVKI